MSNAKKNATKGRDDISRFVVHLTRDDKNDFSSVLSAGLRGRKKFCGKLATTAI